MQLFIGMTFRQDHLQYKKIDSFRKRFDEKYSRSDVLQMSLLPPFKIEEIPLFEFQDFVDELADDIDTQLNGHDHHLEVDFNGFDFLTGRKGVLFLKPTIPVDIFHCQESLQELVKEVGGSFNKHKNLGKSYYNDLQTFLPIGRFSDMSLLSQAVDKAQLELSSPFKLTAKDITLFEKMPGMWVPRKILHTFPKSGENFQSEKSNFSILKTPVNL